MKNFLLQKKSQNTLRFFLIVLLLFLIIFSNIIFRKKKIWLNENEKLIISENKKIEGQANQNNFKYENKKSEPQINQNSFKKNNLQIYIEKNTAMKFIKISSGCFYMGSPNDETGRNQDEGPVHKKCLEEYYIGQYEVTVNEFNLFIKESGYITEAEKEGYSWIYKGKWKKAKGYNWKNAGYDQDSNHPVVNVSYNDACAMANWMSKNNSHKFELPSESQWEYACRAGNQSSRFWGDDPNIACKYSNVADSSAKKKFLAWSIHLCEDNYIYTAPVGTFLPNDFGLFDMLGNVWEFCNDRYDIYAYYQKSKKFRVYTKNTKVVIRGGSWYSRKEYIRCASRDNLRNTKRRGFDLGFRLVLYLK